MINEKVGGGIQTGTPTIIATSSLAFRSGATSYVKKAGNVVNFMIQVTVSADTAVNTDLIQLPYNPVATSQGLMAQQGVTYEATITTTGRIQTPWQKVLASKTNATFSGTYLTED